MQTQKWLRCNLDRGMFSNEMAVTYPTSGTARASVFVPTSDVSGNPGELGKVRVTVVTRGGNLLAILSTSYSDSVTVSETDLSDTP